ncbi:hypothetical protein BH20ACI3_BH20ACI3_38550 [soil metagenome]
METGSNSIPKLKSKIKNNLETIKRGQGARRPDRLITKKAAVSSSIFLGVTPAPSILPNLRTNTVGVKPTTGEQDSIAGAVVARYCACQSDRTPI